MKKSWLTKILLILALGIMLASYRHFQLDHYLTLESLRAHQTQLADWHSSRPGLFAGAYFAVYVLATALSIPGATILTLAAGAFFGLAQGLLLVSFASTIGATLAFLGSRFLFQDAVRNRLRDTIDTVNRGFEKEGALYLLTLRLVPIFPFFLVNLVVALTSIRLGTYFLVSQLGMLPGTFVYVNAGTHLAEITSLNDILSPGILASFFLIGIFPIFAKRALSWIRRGKNLRKFKRPSKFDYNIIVIGGGSAGLVTAYIASAVKAKVALIEKHKMGGDCLNTGCVPSKALIRSAKIFSYFKRSSEFGFDSLPVRVDFAKVMERVQRIVKAIEPHDSVERYTRLGVDCIQGEARIKSPFEVEVNGRILTTRNIVVATGASPLVPPIPGLPSTRLTSDNIWNLRHLPSHFVVLGGGPIGCEIAQSFARLGSKVTIIEMGPRIMPREDSEVSAFVSDIFSREGVTVLVGHKAVRCEDNGGKNALICEHEGREVSVPFDQIMVALGRKANVNGFGLEELGVALAPQGTIVADEFLRTTNFPNIYVCGDVTGPYQFTHTASHQAWFVAVNALFSPFRKYKVDYRVIPWSTFVDPEVARVGLNELEAKAKGIDYEVTRYGIDDLDRAIADEEARGFVKVLTVPRSDKILGVTIVGHHASDIISEYVAAMKHGFGMNKILGTIHIYPTFSEANKYAAGVWKRTNAPKGALALLQKFHAWRRR